MRVLLSIRKTLEENAENYFESGKKARRKREGALLAAGKAKEKTVRQAIQQPALRRKEWYERFRWTKNGETLIIAGKDASSNETIIKHHMLATDTVLHTDAAGSPFAIIKGTADEETLHAAATLVACYSKAWKEGLSVADVFAVKPSQVSKTPNTGEFIGKGSFIIRGEKTYLRPKLELCIGVLEEKPFVGTPSAFGEKPHLTLKPGAEKTSDITKKLTKRFGFTQDAWSSLIPSGGCVITTHKNVPNQEKKR